MINCKYIYKGSNWIGFEIKGHAGYCEYGSDIVCAAVSILTQSLILGLNKILKIDCTVKTEEGYALCELKELSVESIAMLDTFKLAMNILQEQFSDYIRIEEEYRWELNNTKSF